MGDDDDTDAVLMEATYRTLAERGYEGLTMRAVAEQAGMSRGLLHYHFEDKADLVHSLLDHLLDRMAGSIRDADGESPAAALRSLLRWNAYGPDRDPSTDDDYFLAIFALRARAPYDEAIRERLARNYERVVAECAAIVAEGIEAGSFREVDPDAIAVFLVTAVDGARNTDLTVGGTDARTVVFEIIDRVVMPALVAEADRE